MNAALIALGANLGDPPATLRWARGQLGPLGEVTAASRLYRTAPVGGPPGQPDYLNAALALSTDLAPPDLLAGLLDVERRAGRVRAARWGPRALDLDLLAYGGLTLRAPGLELPHPRLLERAFVLAPLSEIAPDWRHPITGQSVREALWTLDRSGVQVAREAW